MPEIKPNINDGNRSPAPQAQQKKAMQVQQKE